MSTLYYLPGNTKTSCIACRKIAVQAGIHKEQRQSFCRKHVDLFPFNPISESRELTSISGDLEMFVDWLRTVKTVLKIRCPKAHVSRAKDLYRKIKGIDCYDDMLDVNGSVNTWSNMYYVFFPIPPDTVHIPVFSSQSKMGDGGLVKATLKGSQVELCSKELLVYLLEHGFNLGENPQKV